MKFNKTYELKNHKGLHSSVFCSYMIALSPIIVIILGLISLVFCGDVATIGLMSKMIYFYAIIIPISFLSVDLYAIIIKEREFKGFKETIKNHPELFVLLGFLFWNILATIIQIGVFGSSKALTTMILPLGIQEGIFAFIVYGACLLTAFYVNDQNIIKQILSAFMYTAVLISFLALIDPHSSFYFHSVNSVVWSGMFINSNHFSYYLTLAIILAGAGVIFEKTKWKWILCVVFVSILSVVMMLVDTFGCTLAVFVTFIIIPIVLCAFKQKFDWKYLLPLGIFILSTFVVIPIAKPLNSLYTGFFKQIINLFKESSTIIVAPTSTEAAHAGTDRWQLWLKAIEDIINNPIIGNGNVLLRPHNEYLQYAQVWGIPSLILYLSAFVIIFVKAIKNRKNISNLNLTLLFIVGGYLISATFGNTMPHTTPTFALILGFLIRSLNMKKTNAMHQA